MVDIVTPIKPEVVRTGYDEVAETSVPGQLLSEVVDVATENGEGILSATVVGRSQPFGRKREPSGVPQISGQTPNWTALTGAGLTISPPYNPDELVRLPHVSSILPQCLRALVQGIHGHGFGFEPTFDATARERDLAFMKAAEEEKQRAKRFFEQASLEYSFAELAARTRLDLCTVGWSGWEFIRDMTTGELCGFEHASGPTLRLGVQDHTPTLIHRWVMTADGSRWQKVPAWRYLRRYVQIVNGRMSFFKEIGDPRAIDRRTGAVISAVQRREDLRNPNMAHELLWFSHYDPASPEGYGVPPWIGTLVDLAGERAASEVNWTYFGNKSVPPLAILVQGGALTKESHDRIAEKLDELKGVENWHKVLILEATDKTGGSVKDLLDPAQSTTPRVTVEKLTDAQHGDALFQNYTQASREKVRSACGVPPILIGESSDYTRATAQVSMEVAETFTFGPQRNRFDDRVQRFVMSELQIRWWEFTSGTPNLANVEEIAKAIESGVKAGVGNPNVYAQVLERVLGVEIPQNELPWASFPIDLTKIALQSGLVSLDFTTGEMGAAVNEGQRDKFKQLVSEMVEATVDSVLTRARYAAVNAEQP